MEPEIIGFEAWWESVSYPNGSLFVEKLKPQFKAAWEFGYNEGTVDGYEEALDDLGVEPWEPQE